MSDFQALMLAQANTRAASNAYEAASLRLELCRMRERIAHLNSQAEPLGTLDIDREKVRQVLTYVSCGRLKP
jgi:hypothetical protein